MSTLVTRRTQVHRQNRVMHATGYDLAASGAAHELARFLNQAGLGAAEALRQAYERLYHWVQAQATTLPISKFHRGAFLRPRASAKASQ
jgi:hypothetical protein